MWRFHPAINRVKEIVDICEHIQISHRRNVDNYNGQVRHNTSPIYFFYVRKHTKLPRNSSKNIPGTFPKEYSWKILNTFRFDQVYGICRSLLDLYLAIIPQEQLVPSLGMVHMNECNSISFILPLLALNIRLR